MDKRKELILNTIIREHIKTGVPVGSGVLVEKYKLNISPATARNEMAELEEDGFIVQPHTSAGRVPTEKAYNLYVENLSARGGEKKIGEAEAKIFAKLLKEKNELNFKQAAKMMAKVSGEAVFWAFHKNNLYYTGISNLLAQPEFAQTGLIYDISVVIDKVDEIIDNIFSETKMGTQIQIGSDNPFGNFCGTILTKYKYDGKTGLFGILGPMRMNYEKNMALVNYISGLLGSKQV
ncbi:hypothetical protein HY798_00135 [Candidatus Falkowbacteria bacterium]|nr:hypothetical protein [Candidatus Falkowbacteria bacterium]